MTTYTIYSTVTDGAVASSNATYATAVAGAGLVAATGASGYEQLGQQLGYAIWQLFFEFDCSVISGSETVDSAVFYSQTRNNFLDTNFTLEARDFDFGATVDTTDWRTDSQLGALTLLGSISSASITVKVYFGFSDTAMAALVDNKSATTRFMVCSDRNRTATAPTANEYLNYYLSEQVGTSRDPYLDVTASAAAGAKPYYYNQLVQGA